MYSAIEHVARSIWLGKYCGENLMLMAHTGYFDASGKESDPVLVVAGAVAPVGEWIKFEREWSRVLKRENVTEFRAADFASSKGEYIRWLGDKARRSRFLHDLGTVLRNAASRVAMLGVESDAWNALNQEFELEEVFHSRYAMAGFGVVEEIIGWRKKHQITAPIEYIFEDGDEGWSGLVKLCEKKTVVPIRLPKSKSVAFQAADLLAWKGRIAFKNSLRHELEKAESLYPAVAKLKRLDEEYRSLQKVLVCPGDPGIVGLRALRENCQKFKIPKRQPRPVTPPA